MTTTTPNGAVEFRPVLVPLRFAAGDLRLLTIGIKSVEVCGHFLERPITVEDCVAAYAASGGKPIFGRSVPFTDPNRDDLNESQKGVRFLRKYKRHYVDMSGTFQDYMSKFSSRSRSTLLRKVRKFEAASQQKLNWSTFRTPEDVDTFLSEALPLSEATYQHRLLDSGLPRSESFRERLLDLAARNQFRGWILRLDAKPVAYICSEAVERTLLYEYVGFDPRAADLSPGTVLQYLVLEQLFSEGHFRYFDFTEGEGSHKEFFGTHHMQCADVFICGDALSPRLWLGAHRSFEAVAGIAIKIVNQLGLKARLKRILRRA